MRLVVSSLSFLHSLKMHRLKDLRRSVWMTSWCFCSVKGNLWATNLIDLVTKSARTNTGPADLHQHSRKIFVSDRHALKLKPGTRLVTREWNLELLSLFARELLTLLEREPSLNDRLLQDKGINFIWYQISAVRN